MSEHFRGDYLAGCKEARLCHPEPSSRFGGFSMGQSFPVAGNGSTLRALRAEEEAAADYVKMDQTDTRVSQSDDRVSVGDAAVGNY
jgi:hypothetical protein